MKWFDRRFPSDIPVELFPNIVERLRGTPARLEERLRPIPQDRRIQRHGGTWSIQENAGHLWDLERLFLTRMRELQAGQPELSPADLANALTWERNHNAARTDDLLASLRQEREILVRELEAANAELIQRSARHPRLGTPMRLVDLAFFVAEHDDHHLARITQLLRLL